MIKADKKLIKVDKNDEVDRTLIKKLIKVDKYDEVDRTLIKKLIKVDKKLIKKVDKKLIKSSNIVERIACCFNVETSKTCLCRKLIHNNNNQHKLIHFDKAMKHLWQCNYCNCQQWLQQKKAEELNAQALGVKKNPLSRLRPGLVAAEHSAFQAA